MTTLYFGGKIYTMLAENDCVEAVIVTDGVITHTGSYAQLQPYAQDTYDLQGATMYPGFVDSHLHIIGYGEKLMHVDVSQMTTRKQMMDELKVRAQQAKPSDWVIAIGYNENHLDDSAYPTMQELDILGDCHIIIKRQCHHLIIANTKALQFAHITPQTIAPTGGIIVKESGQLTGVLKDAALYLIVNHMPHITPNYIETALQKAIQSLLSMGLVGGHSEDLSYYGAPTQPLAAFEKVVNKPKIFKAHLLQHHSVFEQTVNSIEATPWLALGAMKIFIDGAFGGRTAYLFEDYRDDAGNLGILVHSEQELERLVQLARNYEQTVAVHVIGDAAMAVILQVFKKYPPRHKGQLDRLIHASLVNDALLQQIAQLPVALDIQPAFFIEAQNALRSRLGDDRLAYTHLAKSFLCENIVAGGSDAPIEHPNPVHGMYYAITRAAQGQEIVKTAECLSRFEALSLYTTGAAAINNMAHKRGKIARGYEADFTILQQDILTIPLADYFTVQVQATIVHGKEVYSKTT